MSSSENPTLIEILAYKSVKWTSSSWAFGIALIFTIIWLVLEPSSNWMDTASSVTTFLMVFLLQRAQNKDSLAMQVKLNEIIAALKGANNHLINIENLSEAEILALQKRYQTVASHLHEHPERLPSTEKISAHEMAKELESKEKK